MFAFEKIKVCLLKDMSSCSLMMCIRFLTFFLLEMNSAVIDMEWKELTIMLGPRERSHVSETRDNGITWKKRVTGIT